jgi:transketolase
MSDGNGAAAQMGRVAPAGPFGQALVEVAARRPDVVAVTADLTQYTDLRAFQARFPERYVNVGMAEQNLVAVSAGLAMAGFTPVTTTFAVFLTRRAYDFVAMQIAVHRANVKLACSLVGICSTFGPTHQGIEDIAHMRALPNMVVIDPCDPIDMAQATVAAIEYDGPVYLRMLLGSEPVVVDPDTHQFRLGQAVLLRPGSDVGIIASSIMVARALAAADELAAEGIDAAVLQVSSIKPFDEQAVLELSELTGALVTAENHTIIGGLFSAVAETLARHGVGVPVLPVGMRDEFGSFGTLEYVAERHGLTSAAIIDQARLALERRDSRARA